MRETDVNVSQLSFAIFDAILPQPGARTPRRRGRHTEETWAPSAEGLFGRPVGEAEVRGGMAIWPDAEHWWRVGEIATRTILLEVVGDVHARDIAEYATRIRESENPILPATIDEVRALLERHAARIGVASRPAPPATPPEPAVATGATPAETAPRPIVGDQGAATAHTDAVDGEDDGGRDAASAAAGSGDHSDARVAPRVVVEAAPEKTRPDAGNFYLSAARPLAATWRERARDNIAAIALMKEIEAEGRAATPDEQARLITYVGWGASDLANTIFPTGREARAEHGWEGLAAEVRAALTPREYADARRGTQYSHYTPEPIVRWVWAAVRRLGFDGGAVLEPGMGTGLFIGLTPPELRGRARFTGIEFDSVAAGIARLLYPGADVRCQDFATSALPPAYDLAVGNPPFSDLAVTVDPGYRRLRPRLHDYFMVKSVDLLRPGGLLAFVTSRGTLDKANDAARRYIADRADLVAAVRLPRGSFMATAGTDTVVDIVILRKRGTGEAPGGLGWMSLAATAALGRDDQPIVVNEYFAAHPEMALGTHRMVSGRFGQDTYTLDPTPGEDLASALATTLDRLPVGIYPSRATSATAPSGASTPVADAADAAVVNATPGSREGSYLVARDGTLMQVVGGVAAPVPIKRSNSRGGMYRTHARIVAALIPIRDAVRDILREQARDGDWAPAQRRLRAAYDRFVAAHGPINLTTYPQASVPTGDGAADSAAADNDAADALAERGRARTPNLTPFLDDPDAYLVASIEIYNEETGEATKGPIFTGRVVAPPGPPEIVSSHDALNVVLNERGRVDIPRIAELLAWTEDAVVADLADAVFLDPATERWEMRDAYLSGDVRAKLQMAETAMELDPRYRRNAEALRDVLPVDLKPSDVTARLGQPWIPTDVVEAFAQEVLGAWAEVRHTAEAASWSVNAPTLKTSATGTSEWGTDRRNAGILLEDALNARTPQIYDTVWDGPIKKEELNVKATEAAREKLAKIKAAFQEWAWRDSDRALRLLDIYNQRYNSLVPRHFNGAHLTLPGISCVFQLYDHQKRAIWRILSAGSTYLAHAVGAGKAQPLDAKILTPTGWKRMGETTVGERVIAGDGSPTVVTGVFPQGEKEIFRVTFSDGSSTECCAEHLWLTQTYAERTATHNEATLGRDWPSAKPKVRALAEIARTLRDPRLGVKNHSIPMVGPVEFDDRPVPIDPYLLGVLLGDGSLRGKTIKVTTADAELVGHIEPVLPRGVTIKAEKVGKRCPSYRLSTRNDQLSGNRQLNPLKEALTGLGLHGTTSATKFIPAAYLFNGREKRLALLQGLLDTDGTCSRRGTSVSFATISAQLALGVMHLVQSLGGVVRTTHKTPTYRHNGEACVGRMCYVLCLSLPPDIAPFRLSRKACRVRPKTSYKPTRYIITVEPVGRKEARCISVAHPGHLYVTDDFLVTHNTATAIATIMEQKRLGLVSKPIIVVPNSTLKQWAREFMALYPHAKILVADEVQFHRARRQRFLARAATGIWDAVVITHSAFPFIPVPEDFERDLVRDQLDEFAAILADVGSEDRVSRKQIERQMEGMRQRIEALAARKDDLVDMAEIGIDQIIVDEAHLERKLSFPTNMGTIKGVDPQGSQRAWDLWVKSRYVLRAHNPKRGLVLASGTPVTNTLGEMFTIQRYLQEDILRARDLHLFDAWASTFGDVRTELELQPSGKYKSVSRFAEFVNVPELIQMFRSFADVLTAGDLKGVVALPSVHGGRREIVRCPASDSFKGYQATLAARIAAIEERRGPPRKGDDILLSVITDGRHAAMDMRLVYRDHTDEPANKVNACVDNVARIWEETASLRYRRPDGSFYETPGAAQLVFSDLGTPAVADKRGFSVYHWIRERLIARGIPARQIAFMQDYDTSERKLKLFQAVNAGTVRVLIGSTATMGVGVNAQTRLAALHHVCVPWVPADLEQREGRIVRQGNQNEQVRLYAYATLGSLDAQMWQTLERKAKFIEAALKGDTTIRRMEDVGESQSNQFAIAKALASGDERLLRKAGLDGEVGRLRRLKAAHFDDQIAIRRNIDLSESAIGYADKRIAAIEEDIARRRDTRGDAFRMTVGRAVYTERKAAGAALLFAIGRNVRQRLDGAERIGAIGGFDIRYKGCGSIRTSAYDYDILIERTQFDQPVHISLGQPELGVVATFEHALRDFEKNLAHYEMERMTARRRVADFVPRLGQPFEFDRELIDKQAELDALEVDLARAEDGAAEAATLPLAPPAAPEGELSPGSGEKAARHAAEDGHAA